MKFTLFCENPYAFAILAPLRNVLTQKEYDFIWFLPEKLLTEFPFKEEQHTTDIHVIDAYKSDVILVPGNDVPHYLRGLKVQIFHGLAGEKKGHFRIRHYFDLYLTQGPYFTKKFNESRKKHKDFDVIETGWSKLDIYSNNKSEFLKEKDVLKLNHKAKKIILYAPTFSPSLTSAPFLKKEIQNLAANTKHLILIKFHDLMSDKLISEYKSIANKYNNIIFLEERNILKYLIIADIMISDTSSVVFEFLLLNKPVITYKSIKPKNAWENINDDKLLSEKIQYNLNEDPYAVQRAKIIEEYHPYNDGKSSLRMIQVIENYVKENGVPERRNLPLLRRFKMNRKYK